MLLYWTPVYPSFGCVLVRRPALIRLRPYLGRGEAGGEDSMRFPVSDCNHWHKNEARVYGWQVASILLMMKWSFIRTRTRLCGCVSVELRPRKWYPSCLNWPQYTRNCCHCRPLGNRWSQKKTQWIQIETGENFSHKFLPKFIPMNINTAHI